MKVLLDIKDDKVPFILELLSNFKFVKIEPLSPYKSKVFKGLKNAIKEVNQIKAGKKKAKSIRSLLDEL